MIESQTAIELINISKSFKVRERQYTTLKKKITHFFNKEPSVRTIKALSNININIKQGETFGIIGRNGSGKSTLLNIIMQSIPPDKDGTIKTKGRLMRLALGMGVDMNLSARDNIYVNGSVLGLTFKEIGHIFYDIIDFAGLEDFVDTPVKLYSSGMKQRLMFSIAMYAKADTFLLDEFFGGTGDDDFRKKSDLAFKNKILEGNTIVIVSHSMSIISKYCTRVAWIHKGHLKMVGPPNDVILEYRSFFKKVKGIKDGLAQ